MRERVRTVQPYAFRCLPRSRQEDFVFGWAMRVARRQLGLTRHEVARLIGTTYSRLVSYELYGQTLLEIQAENAVDRLGLDEYDFADARAALSGDPTREGRTE